MTTRILNGLLLAIALFATPLHAGAADRPLTKIESGTIRGLEVPGGLRFLGIPYAAPPVGDLRFKAPQPAAKWRGVRTTVLPGSSCAQQAVPDLHLIGSQSEDCLYLNVYTPALKPAQPLPVMVWIHGGGFVTGSGAVYLAGALSKEGQVVVVTINYRLGPFGFLAHPALQAESAASVGNYGLLDQQAAINWVQRNAAAFGGDPQRITVFGESAGGASTCAQLAAPAMQGVFQRAIIQSGLCTDVGARPLQQALATGQQIATQLQCPIDNSAQAAACLRKLPVDSLLAAEGEVVLTSEVPFGPVYGTPALPLLPSQAFAAGQYNAVPVLIGSTHDEARLPAAVQFDMQDGPLTPETYAARVTASYGTQSADVLARYPASNYASPNLAYSAAYTNALFACDAWRTAQALATQSQPVYFYEFADEDAPAFINTREVTIPLGAYHGADTTYLFLNPLAVPDAEQRPLAQQMRAYWAQFAYTGNPNRAGLQDWPRYVSESPTVLQLKPQTSEQRSDFATDHDCAFWSSIQRTGTPL